MSTADLTNQLSAISESLKTTNTLITRLAKLHLQPGSEPLDGEQGVRVELAQEIHVHLKELEDELDLWKQSAEDLQTARSHRRRQSFKDTDEAQLGAKAARVGEELIHSRQRFRNAQVTAKAHSEEAKRKEREAVFASYRKQADQLASLDLGADRDQLFTGRNRRGPEQKQLTKDELLVSATSDVTAALRRTHDLLSTELTRSRFAKETLEESTAALGHLDEQYTKVGDILGNSKKLIGTLLRSQKSDTWYLETAFYVLITVICWLFFRRFLYGPFFKLPSFLWRVSVFLLKWLVWRPFYFLLTVSGVIVSEPIRKTGVKNFPSKSRAPLIVHNSAKRGPVSFETDVLSAIRGQGVPAGAGGAGAKDGASTVLGGKMSEQIGKMAEDSAKQDRVPAGQPAEQEPVRRGDGTILQERNEPANPKKKVFDADVDDEKQKVRKRDEL